MNLAELAKPVLQISILLIVFGLGLKANWRDAMFLFHEPGLLLRSLLAMNLIMPLTAIALIAVFQLAPAVKIALVALSLSPVPPILPIRQFKLSGDESYVYSLLVVASVLAIGLVPLWISLLGIITPLEAQIPPSAVARIVFLTILLPLGAGMLLREFAPEVARQVAEPASIAGTMTLLLGAVVILIMIGPAMISLIGHETLLAMIAFIAVGLLAGHLLGGPAPENRSTLALATISRHPAIAFFIAAVSFQEAKPALVAILLYLIVNALAAIPYMLWCKHRLLRIQR